MPLTKQIIADVVRDVVRQEIKPLETRFDTLETRFDTLETRFDTLEQKVDTLNTTVTDLAGQFNKFDEEQTVLSGQMSNRTDRIEKLETKVFGSTQA